MQRYQNLLSGKFEARHQAIQSEGVAIRFAAEGRPRRWGVRPFGLQKIQPTSRRNLTGVCILGDFDASISRDPTLAITRAEPFCGNLDETAYLFHPISYLGQPPKTLTNEPIQLQFFERFRASHSQCS
jgi:hypothetical protein